MTDNLGIATQINDDLASHADVKNSTKYQKFFKEPLTFYGIGNVEMKKITAKWQKQVKALGKLDGLSVCEKLFEIKVYEPRILACVLSNMFTEELVPEDIEIFSHWVNTYVDNWAVCDTFCNHTVGYFIMKFPGQIKHLKVWADSKNRWVKRAAGVSLIIPARKGFFLSDIFEIADKMLLDKDDIVQKGYGWMLKAASQAHQKEVFDYVVRHKATMPRTALRYAIEKMPKEMRQKAMAKT
jgi:3-methyladenine DNA glycosylase AlkD